MPCLETTHTFSVVFLGEVPSPKLGSATVAVRHRTRASRPLSVSATCPDAIISQSVFRYAALGSGRNSGSANRMYLIFMCPVVDTASPVHTSGENKRKHHKRRKHTLVQRFSTFLFAAPFLE